MHVWAVKADAFFSFFFFVVFYFLALTHGSESNKYMKDEHWTVRGEFFYRRKRIVKTRKEKNKEERIQKT